MAGLSDLLRAELTAVNQQFIHVLALNRLGHEAMADRIYEVDVVDFPNAMRIIDHLMASGEDVHLPPELPRPGFPMRGLLQAELHIEARMRDLLATADATDDAAQRLFESAAAPRPAYHAWLTGMLAESGASPEARGDAATDPLFACLIAVLEHLMIRAFAAWHAGDEAEADRAWAMSGMAMVQATDLVNALTDLGAVPLASGMRPTVLPARRGDIAVERDLMAAYAGAAQDAAQRAEPPLQEICNRVADYTQSLEAWQPGTPHPAVAACAPSFRSFSATLRKFVRPAP
jgi:bacterioferritin (cytochrome b1)